MDDDIIEFIKTADVHRITIEIPLQNNIEKISINQYSDTAIIQIKNTYYIVNEKGEILGYYYKDKVENISNFFDDLAIINSCFIDKSGNIVIDCSDYDEIEPFSEGLARVKKNNSWYFIDKSGNIAIDCSDYDEVYTFFEGLAKVKKNNSWYFIDKSGNIVIDCSDYDKVCAFSEDLAPVRKNDSWYFIDKAGNIVIDCSNYDEVYAFSEGLARVRKNDSWYFINKAGDIELNCEELKAFSDYKDGYCVAANNTQIYCYDKLGNVIQIHNNLHFYHLRYDIECFRGKTFTAIRYLDNIIFLSHYRLNQTIPQAFDHITITKEFKNLDEFLTYTEQLPRNWKVSRYSIGFKEDEKIDYSNADLAIKSLVKYAKVLTINFDEWRSKPIRKPKSFTEEEVEETLKIIFEEKESKPIREPNPPTEEEVEEALRILFEEKEPKQTKEKIENETSTPEKQNSKNSSEYIKSFIERIQKKFLHQENAISLLCANIFANKKVIETKDSKLIRNQKSNILLDGPSGTGKSAILHEIADKLDIPIVDISITDYTPTGYAGASLNEIIKLLIKKSGNDIEKAQKGIIILDEFDKLSSKKYKDQHNTDEESFKKQLQNEILTYLGGEKVTVPLSPGETIEFDTSQITFICAGAFTDLRETAGDNFNQEDLTENGFSQELVGRLNTFISTKSYTIEEYKDILINSPISPLTAFASFCKLYNINDFVFMPDFLDEVAKEAYDLDLGVRGLQQIINRVKNFYLTDIVLGNKTQIILTKSIVELSKEKGR